MRRRRPPITPLRFLAEVIPFAVAVGWLLIAPPGLGVVARYGIAVGLFLVAMSVTRVTIEYYLMKKRRRR